ncbi:RICIN domain-containing protein [Streptomyces prunicolor]|jgi:hypothetical protein|uniref:RICIN domain-containing protein n=1 Tax=Streptomyces prunicolor TaxID=67348 RepID=UPI000476796E
MRRHALRKTATRLAALAAASLSVLTFTSPASADTSTVSPQSVTYYQYQLFYYSKCLDVAGQANGSIVQQYTCNGTVNQQWSPRATDSGYFQMVVASSGRCMEVVNSSQDNYAVLQINDCNGGYNQQWTTRSSTRSNWPLLVARHSGKCLTPYNFSSVDRAQMMQYTCISDATYMQWNRS